MDQGGPPCDLYPHWPWLHLLVGPSLSHKDGMERQLEGSPTGMSAGISEYGAIWGSSDPMISVSGHAYGW